jgi:hypothetical protein
MDYIYIDESGDLGSKKSSSRYFVIVAIKVDDSRKLDRIIKKTRRLTKKQILTSNEIKGCNLPYNLKIKILKKLDNVDYEAYIIVFDKLNRYKIDHGYDNNELYDILASQLARLINIDKTTIVFIDKSKNKMDEIRKFNKRFLNNLVNSKKHSVTITHANSIHYKGLQIADLISWSTFQCVEYHNDEFLDLVKNKIMREAFKN